MDTDSIWKEITSKPKWYAGLKTSLGSYHSAQSAYKLKQRYREGSLSENIIEMVFNAHGYTLEKSWVKE